MDSIYIELHTSTRLLNSAKSEESCLVLSLTQFRLKLFFEPRKKTTLCKSNRTLMGWDSYSAFFVLLAYHLSFVCTKGDIK